MAGNERQELAAIAADLRAHLKWLGDCGARELPRPAPPPTRAPAANPAGAAAVAAPGGKGPSLLEMVRARVGPAGGRGGATTAVGPSAAPVGAGSAPSPSSSAPPRAQRPEAGRPVAPSPLSVVRGAQALPASASLEAVRAQLGDCRRCRLAGGRGRLVFGEGAARAELVFIGEVPSVEEDAGGGAFDGAAGELLGKMVEAMGFARGEVYLCSLVKCRPPDDRKPGRDELDACEPFLKAQLAALQPKAIVALGKFAAQRLLRDASPITELRGRWREYCGIRLMPTYHPAYLLRSPREKAKVWEDLQQVMREVGRGPTGRR